MDGNVGDRAALLHLLKELEDAGNELEDMMDNLINETASKDVPALQTEKDGVVTAQDAALTLFGLLITARTTPTTDPSAAPGGARQIFKLQAELKPFLLWNTHSPPEMRNWLVQFKSYASTSNIHLVGVADQRAVLRGCMTPDLEVNLEGVLATPASTVAIEYSGDRGALLVAEAAVHSPVGVFQDQEGGSSFQGLRGRFALECCGGRYRQHLV
jgi:hypothetical protein